MPPFDGKYNPDAYLNLEIVVDQKNQCHAYPVDHRVRSITSDFSDFVSIW